MPLPLILAGAALLAGGYGVKKGFDAKEDFERAERIGNRAKNKHDKAEKNLGIEKNKTNQEFIELGELKVSIFTNQIKHLVETLKRYKPAISKIKDFDASISIEEMKEMERLVLGGLEIQKGLASGAATGALAGIGAFSAVGALGAASTGTAIASLSGVAATNATLAWFGGGAIASGGFGMGVGAYAIGGIVVGPALAVGGFLMAKKAEEAYTQATQYEAKVETAIAEMKKIEVVMQGLQKNALEMKYALTEISNRFDSNKVFDNSDENAFNKMIVIGKALKGILDNPIMEQNGSPVANIKQKISGYLEI